MDIDWYKASRMNKLSLNHRVATLSDEMKELLDEIYVLSRSGKFSIMLDDINQDDIELLMALEYEVRARWIPTEITDYIGETPVYHRIKKYVVSWN